MRRACSYPSCPGTSSAPRKRERRSATAAPGMTIGPPLSLIAAISASGIDEPATPSAHRRRTGSAAIAALARLAVKNSRRFIGSPRWLCLRLVQPLAAVASAQPTGSFAHQPIDHGVQSFPFTCTASPRVLEYLELPMRARASLQDVARVRKFGAAADCLTVLLEQSQHFLQQLAERH